MAGFVQDTAPQFERRLNMDRGKWASIAPAKLRAKMEAAFLIVSKAATNRRFRLTFLRK